jgi:hypothetical protein
MTIMELLEIPMPIFGADRDNDERSRVLTD